MYYDLYVSFIVIFRNIIDLRPDKKWVDIKQNWILNILFSLHMRIYVYYVR